MIEAMTTATRTARRPRRVAAFIAAVLAWVLAVAVGLFTAGSASALTASAAESRVGASHSAVAVLVGRSAGITAGQRLGNDPPRPGIVVATGVAANTGRADFIASADGVVVPTSRSRLVAGFEEAGLPSTPTTSAGTQYTLPNGSLVRVMEPSGQAGLRASFTNANGGPINPFTGKPVQPPPGLSKPARLDYIRSRTHIELGP